MLYPHVLYKEINKKIIPGKFVGAFVLFNNAYYYEQLRVYADRTVAGTYAFHALPIERKYDHVKKFMPKINKESLVGTLGNTSDENINAMPFDDFKYLVLKGIVTLHVQEVARFGFPDLPYMDDTYYELAVDFTISSNDFLKTIEDTFCILNNQPPSWRICLNTLCELLHAPKTKKELWRKKLMKAYYDVPEYQRSNIYVLSIDLKGRTPIEDIIFKKEGRLENYDEFVKVYDDIYFEEKYKNLDTKKS